MEQAYAEMVLNWLLRGDTLTPPSTWYFGLDVSVSGSSYTEPTYVGYARASLTRGTGSWVSATGVAQIVSAADVTWVTVPSGYTAGEVIRRVFISDSSTSSGETLLAYVPLSANPTLAVAVQPKFVSGNIVLNT